MKTHDKACEENDGRRVAVSNPDPALIPARTAEELEEFKRARLQATILEKRQFKQQKKLDASPGNVAAKDTTIPSSRVLIGDK